MDELGTTVIEVAVMAGALAVEMRRNNLLSDEAMKAFSVALKGIADRLDLLDEPNEASVQLNSLANYLRQGP